MINEYIIWRKVYKVNHQDGQFKILISSHFDGIFYGTVIYYSKTGARDSDEHERMVHLDLKHKNLVGRTEDEVYNACIVWLKQNVPGNFTTDLASHEHEAPKK